MSDETAPTEAVTKEGFLWKTGSNNKGWRERYFVLSKGRLSYYKNDKIGETAQGYIDLAECENITTSPGRKGFGFDISVPGRVYNVSADTEEAQMEWITAINSSVAVVRSLQADGGRVVTSAGRGSVSGGGVAGFLKRRSRRDTAASVSGGDTSRPINSSPERGTVKKDDAVHSLLEAEVDALRGKIADLGDSLQTSQASCTKLQNELKQCRQQHARSLTSMKEENGVLYNQVKSLEQAKQQLEMMNDSYNVQLQEKDEDIEGLQEEIRTLEEESAHTQHQLDEAQQRAADLHTQCLRDGEAMASLEGELDAVREKSRTEKTLRHSLEEEVARLKQQLAERSSEGPDTHSTAVATQEELCQLKDELDSKNRELESVQHTNTQLSQELETLKEKTRQLQLEKDKVMSDLITLRKSHRNMERRLSENEEKLSPHVANKTPHSPTARHSPGPQERTVVAEAEKRAELATRLLQEVQAERDLLKAQLNKHNHSPPSPLRTRASESPDGARLLAPPQLRSKSTPTVATNTPAASDSPPKKPKRPPDNLLNMYRAELQTV